MSSVIRCHLFMILKGGYVLYDNKKHNSNQFIFLPMWNTDRQHSARAFLDESASKLGEYISKNE